MGRASRRFWGVLGRSAYCQAAQKSKEGVVRLAVHIRYAGAVEGGVRLRLVRRIGIRCLAPGLLSMMIVVSNHRRTVANTRN